MLAPASPPPSVRRAIVATMQREAVVRGLRALWPALMVLAGAGAFGVVTQQLPPALLSIVAGATLAGSAWLFYAAVRGFTPIDEQEAKHRLEHQAGLTEMAPLTSSSDRLVGGDAALWSWHRRRLEAMAGALSKPAMPVVTRQDGLRAVALILAIGICVWQPVPASRALNFDLLPLMGDADLAVDAWAQPPDYTGLPAVRLSRDAPIVAVPEGSMIFARMDGANGAPRLRVNGQTIVMARERGQAWTAKAVLKRSGKLSLDRFGARAVWHVTAIKDQAPKLTSADPIKIDPRGRLDVSFVASDDYAIAAAFVRVKSRISLVGQIGQTVFDTPLILEGEPGEDGARRVFVDIADHILTGLDVDVFVVVRDGLGQETVSKPTRLIMPKLDWKTPLGAALQEQRLSILREARPYQPRLPAFATLFDPSSDLPIKLDLREPLLGAPEGVLRAHTLMNAALTSFKSIGVSETALLGLHFARERLALARDIEDAHSVAPILWQMALQAEVADQSPAQQKIAAARQALEQALKNDASQSEISQLTQELREAVGERLDELVQEGQGQGQGESQGQGQSGGSGGGGGDSVSGGDIDSMLRELERSGSAGARQDALDQLDQLGALMEELQAGGAGRGEGGQTEQGGGGGPLDNAMREQRDLSDETSTRKDQNGGAPAPDLADRQDDLADRLAPQDGNQPPSQGPDGQVQAGKDQAAQAMRQAADALRRGDLEGAREAQGRAEQALQQAAQAESADGGQGGDQDPLGRNLPRQDDGKGTKVPDQVEKRRARDVREELRRRQANPNRDGPERDYLDRLLKDR